MIYPFAFSLGVILLFFTGEGLALWYVSLALFVSLFYFRLRAFCAFLCFLSGFAWIWTHAEDHRSSIISPSLEKHSIELTGQACSVAKERDYFVEFEFCIDQSAYPSLVGEKVLLRTAPDHLQQAKSPRIRVSVKLKRPFSSINFQGFSYEHYLFSKRIVATGWISNIAVVDPIEANFFSIHSVRQQFVDHMLSVTEGLEARGVLLALASGERSYIPAAVQRVFRDTGVLHLMAISGLHVGMIGLALWRFLPMSLTGLAGLGFSVGAYVFLVGAPASAQRAGLMLLLLLMVRTGLINAKPFAVFAWVLALVLIFDPLQVLSLGFWYSFIAVALLIGMWKVGWLESQRPVYSFLVVQLLFFLALAPVNTFFGMPHSGVSVIANLFAIPWVSWLILPLVILGVLLSFVATDFAEVPLRFASEAVLFLTEFLQQLNTLQLDVFLFSSWSSSFLYAVLFLLLVLLGRIVWLRYLCLVVLATSLFLQEPRQDSINRLLVFDVGQGASLLYQFDSHAWLYDLGPASDYFSSAESIVLPELRRLGVERDLQGFVVSHGDNDHSGGLSFVSDKLKADYRLSGEPERVGGFDFKRCSEGRVVDERFAVDILYPAKDDVPQNANNASCVVKFISPFGSVLVMGDVDKSVELTLIERNRGALKSDVLIAGHHGAKSSSSITFLKHVRPDYLIISAGFGNRFGHPHPKVLQNASLIGAKVLNTAQLGAIELQFLPEGIDIKTARRERKVPWVARPAELVEDPR